MSKIQEFLQLNNMTAESINREEALKEFRKDICGNRPNSYINSFQKLSKGAIPNEPILAIDAGGTNLRFAVFENGLLINSAKKDMIGQNQKLTADQFFDALAKDVEQYPCKKVGFIFSYQCEVQENKDGKILKLSKELNVEGIEGKLIGEELNKRLSVKREFSILNDTVAAQLSVGADAAIILGTGFNICYTDPNTGNIICSECGHYENMPHGNFDIELSKQTDTKTLDAEKMLSGAYLARLIRLIAESYFEREIGDFSLEDVSQLLSIRTGRMLDILRPEEVSDFKIIVDTIEKRGSTIVAIMLEALIGNTKGAKVALEGSTIFKLPGYLDYLRSECNKIPGLKIDLVDCRGLLPVGAIRSTI